VRRRVETETGPQIEIPAWITHLEVGLRHIDSVDEHGNVALDGVDQLHARRSDWLREHGFEPGDVL
jgi:hypothetical protein